MDEKLAVFLGKLAKAHEKGLLEKAARDAQNSDEHPDERQIRAYFNKKLKGDAEKKILAHLVLCDACHRRAMHAQSLPDDRRRRFVEVASWPVIAAKRRPISTFSAIMASALSVLIILLGIGIFRSGWRDTQTAPLPEPVANEHPPTNSAGTVTIIEFPAMTQTNRSNSDVPLLPDSVAGKSEDPPIGPPAKSTSKTKPPGIPPRFCKTYPSDPRCFPVGGR